PAGHSASTGSRTGTFTGDVIHTRYGPVQIAAVLQHGRITEIRAVQTPSDNGRDREIAASAVPRLTREALDAQSAHIDAVSGATYTSQGYVASLQSALDRAGA
ncbi:FMN-binding protein, partial [Streptomyces palmae]